LSTLHQHICFVIPIKAVRSQILTKDFYLHFWFIVMLQSLHHRLMKSAVRSEFPKQLSAFGVQGYVGP